MNTKSPKTLTFCNVIASEHYNVYLDISCSLFSTSRIWDIQKLGEGHIRLLPHPGYVYTAEFHPRVESIVVTGGYDEVVRVWDISLPEDYNVVSFSLTFI